MVQDYDEWQKWYRETTWPPGVEKQAPLLAWRQAARSAWVDVLLGMSLGAVLWGLGPAPWRGWWWLIAVVVPVVVIVGGGWHRLSEPRAKARAEAWAVFDERCAAREREVAAEVAVRWTVEENRARQAAASRAAVER